MGKPTPGYAPKVAVAIKESTKPLPANPRPTWVSGTDLGQPSKIKK